MNDFIYKDEYDDIIKEKDNFYKIYNIIKREALEVINNFDEEDVIDYFCIIYNEKQVYIIFYDINGKDLLQILTTQENRNFNELFDSDLIREVNVDKPEDEFYHRGYRFNYKEEPYFIKQIAYEQKYIEDTDLMKEINQSIEYFKDKVQERKKEMFNYTKTDSIINNFKFEEKITKEQEYIKDVCSKCKNKDNDKDLCKIVRDLDGNVKCENLERGDV